ncbi:MAG: prolipoprotein diacylglyceryl transferase [Deltaproteobacteria bacterium]|nr:prolipoprotein diacylglyceryl transferase [Deltaproteobacteria bacterium]
MFPIFYTLELTPELARTAGVVTAVLLSLYIVYDGYKTHGRAKLVSTLLQAVAFGTVSLWAALTFLTPERLPAEFGVPLRMYGLMVVVGMVSCFVIQRHFAKKQGLTGDQILTIWVYGGIAALIGARGLHVAVNWHDYAEHPLTALAFFDGGLAFIGAAVVSLLFAILYLRRIGAPLLPVLDALTLGIALTHGFGRLGCFFAGCCYGRPTDLPWGVSFPVGSIAQATLANLGLIGADAATPHLHPTQLYESFATFVIGFLLLAWYRRKPAPGMILTGYLLAYPVTRFFLELVRDDPEREFLFRFPEDAPRLLSTSQTGALIIAPLAALVMWRLSRRPSARVAPTGATPAPD